MKNRISAFCDFFLPRFCMGCEKKLNASQIVVCKTCYQSLYSPSTELLHSEYEKKFRNTNFIRNFTSAFIFEKEGVLQRIIHSLKYENKSRLGNFLGEQIYSIRGAEITDWNIDYIIPVPLFHLKKAERGYNQSYYVAKGLSKALKLRVETSIIKRKRFTPSQTKLNFEERKQNVSEAFALKKKNSILDKNILLIDDVITTGSTINSCARILKESGAANVYAASVAIANPLHSFGST